MKNRIEHKVVVFLLVACLVATIFLISLVVVGGLILLT